MIRQSEDQNMECLTSGGEFGGRWRNAALAM